jgi:hypothetical protein
VNKQQAEQCPLSASAEIDCLIALDYLQRP